MGERIERCLQWAGQLVDQAKSSPLVQKPAGDPKIVIYGAALLAVLAYLLIRATQFLKKPQTSRPATPDLEKPAVRSFKAPQRKPGG
jgi:hypothetical protein